MILSTYQFDHAIQLMFYIKTRGFSIQTDGETYEYYSGIEEDEDIIL